ncbi:MAG: tRNA guanosine(34) transglycosylase Tgt [Armatimonadota bacterium]
MQFEVIHTSAGTHARAGVLTLPHGTVETPAFMPVGTQGVVKTLTSDDLESLEYEMVLANAYHLALRPGAERIAKLGGLHRFMAWPRPILTDSGGFQVMSLAHQRKVTERGAWFRSHIDGAEIDLTPERAVEIQSLLGVDVSMALDVCPPYPCEERELQAAARLTSLWAERCLAARSEGQTLFGIVQGGTSKRLRERSLAEVAALPFDGFALGGVSVGEPTELQRPVVAEFMPSLPADRPRYLMGVGQPKDILHAVKHGADLFDCVLPTRSARHHSVYTLKGVVDVTTARWTEHDGPWDEESVFPLTERYSAAYVRHLFKAGEPTAARIATLHNLSFYRRMMREIREAILSDTWDALEQRYSEA